MPEYRISLSTPVPRSHVPELTKRLYFVSEVIECFSIDPEDDPVTSILVGTSEPIGVDALSGKIHALLAKEVLPQRPADQTIVWRSPHQPPVDADTFAELTRRGDAVELGEGLFALGPPFIAGITYIDRALRGIAVDGFGAIEYRYPTLIDTEALYRTGYPGSFPHLLMWISRLHADIDTYEAFLRQLRSTRDLAGAVSAHSRHAGYMLPPTMCFHTYHHVRQRRVPPGGWVVTSRGKSFRYESRYRHSLERLWDFTIREIVFLGSREQVVEQRQSFLTATTRLVSALGLGGHVELANDSFTGTDETPDRVLSQRLLQLKLELRLPVADDRTVAAASFNLHGTTFAEPFGITLADGQPAHTACVGFGLERFTYALMCRHGIDPAQWPDP